MGKNSRAKLKQRNEEQYEVGHVFERKLSASGSFLYLTSWVGYAQKDWLPLSAFSTDALEQIKHLDAIIDEPGMHEKPQWLLDHEEAKARGVNVEKHTPGYKTPSKRARKDEDGTTKQGSRTAASTLSSPAKSLPRRAAALRSAEDDTTRGRSARSSPTRSLPRRAAARRNVDGRQDSTRSSPARSYPKRAARNAAAAAAEDSDGSVPYEESDEEPEDAQKPAASEAASSQSTPMRSIARRIIGIPLDAKCMRVTALSRAATSAQSTPTKYLPHRAARPALGAYEVVDSEDSEADLFPKSQREAASQGAALAGNVQAIPNDRPAPPAVDSEDEEAAEVAEPSNALREEMSLSAANSIINRRDATTPSLIAAAAVLAEACAVEPPMNAFETPAAAAADEIEDIHAIAKAVVASAVAELVQDAATEAAPHSVAVIPAAGEAPPAAAAAHEGVQDAGDEEPLRLFCNSQAREIKMEEIKEEIADEAMEDHSTIIFDELQPINENEEPQPETPEASPEPVEPAAVNNRLRKLTEQSRADARSSVSCASANLPYTTHRLSISSFEAAGSKSPPKRHRLLPKDTGNSAKAKKAPVVPSVKRKALPAESESDDDSEREEAGIIYPLQRVFDRMTHEDGTVLYLTSWQGSSNMTWEPISSFNVGCMDLIRELEDILDRGAPEPRWFKLHKSYMARQQAKQSSVKRGRPGRPLALGKRGVGRPPIVAKTRPSSSFRGRGRGLIGLPHSLLARQNSGIRGRGRGRRRGFGWAAIKRHTIAESGDAKLTTQEGEASRVGRPPATHIRPNTVLRGRGRGRKRGLGWSNVKRPTSAMPLDRGESIVNEERKGSSIVGRPPSRSISTIRGRTRGRGRGIGRTSLKRPASAGPVEHEMDTMIDDAVEIEEVTTTSNEKPVIPVIPRRLSPADTEEESGEVLPPLDGLDSPPFDWNAHFDKAGGWPAPLNAFWKRRLGRFNNKFEDHIGKLCRVPDFDLHYDGKWATVGRIMGTHGPWVKIHVLDTALAYAEWFLCDDPVLHHFESLDDQSFPRVKQPNMSFSVGHNRFRRKIEQALTNEDGEDNLVPKEVFENQISWTDDRPTVNRFMVGHKLETYDPIAGDGFFHPATVLDVHPTKEEVRIHYDGHPPTMIKTLSYRDWRIFPCGYAAAIGWQCHLPESAVKKVSLRGRWRVRMGVATVERNTERAKSVPVEEERTSCPTQRRRAPPIPGMKRREELSPTEVRSNVSSKSEGASLAEKVAQILAANGFKEPHKSLGEPPAKKPVPQLELNGARKAIDIDIRKEASSSNSVKQISHKIPSNGAPQSDKSVIQHILTTPNESFESVQRYINFLKRTTNLGAVSAELVSRASKTVAQQVPTSKPDTKSNETGSCMSTEQRRAPLFPSAPTNIQKTLDNGAGTIASLMYLNKQRALAGKTQLSYHRPRPPICSLDSPSTSFQRAAEVDVSRKRRRSSRSPTIPMLEDRSKLAPPGAPSTSKVVPAAPAAPAAPSAAPAPPAPSAAPAPAPATVHHPAANPAASLSAADILRIILDNQMSAAQRINTVMEDLAEIKRHQAAGTGKNNVEMMNKAVVELQQNQKAIEESLGMHPTASSFQRIHPSNSANSGREAAPILSIAEMEREKARLLQEQVEMLREENRIIREKLQNARNA